MVTLPSESKTDFNFPEIDFDFPEPYFELDDDGKVVDVRARELSISNKIIEEFMLVANETVAEFAYWAEIPSVYRVHESPSAEKLSAFQLFRLNVACPLTY